MVKSLLHACMAVALLLSLWHDCSAQRRSAAVITGHLLDAGSREPIPNVNVFLSSTTIGTSSDSSGMFTIRNIPYGMFDLVVSHVGYEHRVIPVRIVGADSLHFEFSINQALLATPPVEINAGRDDGWNLNLRRFLTIFIGETEHSDECIILNPEVLKFRVAHDTLLARTDSILRIENRALGYMLKIVLREFVWNTEKDYGHYLISSFFDSLHPRDETERSTWEKNRMVAYRGSLKEFLHSLCEGTTDAEGFTIFSGPPGKLLEGRGHRVIAEELSLQPQTGTPFLRLQFPGLLRVEYGRRANESYDRDYTAGGLRFHERVRPTGVDDVNSASVIALNKPFALIDSLGNLLDPLSLDVAGRWKKSRVAELLPTY